jgi:excisionase family DNA binding protein
MATVSISEAARLAGVSRKTIQRHIANGKLSATLSQGADAAMRQVEISELMRVYGQIVAPVPETSAPQVPSLSSQDGALSQVIEAQKETIDLLKKQVDELVIEKKELRAQVAGLLEYRTPAPAPIVPKSTSRRMAIWGLFIVCLTVIAAITIPLWGRVH